MLPPYPLRDELVLVDIIHREVMRVAIIKSHAGRHIEAPLLICRVILLHLSRHLTKVLAKMSCDLVTRTVNTFRQHVKALRNKAIHKIFETKVNIRRKFSLQYLWHGVQYRTRMCYSHDKWNYTIIAQGQCGERVEV